MGHFVSPRMEPLPWNPMWSSINHPGKRASEQARVQLGRFDSPRSQTETVRSLLLVRAAYTTTLGYLRLSSSCVRWWNDVREVHRHDSSSFISAHRMNGHLLFYVSDDPGLSLAEMLAVPGSDGVFVRGEWPKTLQQLYFDSKHPAGDHTDEELFALKGLPWITTWGSLYLSHVWQRFRPADSPR